MIFRALFHPAILRLYIIGLLMLGGLSVLLVNLWSYQVDRQQEYEAKLPLPKTITVREPAIRGRILDRNGVVLATNERNYALVVNLGDLRRAWHDDAENPQLNMLREDLGAMFDEYLRPKLEQVGVDTAEIRTRDVDRHWNQQREFVSMLVAEHLSWKDVARVEAHGNHLPGVKVVTRPQRRYPFDALAGHVVGYLRPGDVGRDLTEEEKRGYKFDVLDDVGVAGIEATMDEWLAGTPGEREILQDVNGLVVGETSYTPPVRGSDVWLTLDVRMQYIAERALRDAGVGQGAAVVIDPRDGSLLAMASVPNFNPNHYIPSISVAIRQAYDDPKRFGPMMSQALRPTEPGSTFKIPVALAGGLAGIHHNSYQCVPVNYGGSHFFRCWIYRQSGGSHGSVDLPKSAKVSCNAFYYQYANAMGASNFTNGLLMQGLGQRTGVELYGVGEDRGLIPGTDEWRRAYNHPDGYMPNAGDLANASIGQGGTLVNPMQMAGVVSTVANGGTFYQTRAVSHVVGQSGLLEYDNLPHIRARLQEKGVPQQAIDLTREGMRQVVNDVGGTGRRVEMEDWVVAGKTGTAQTSRSFQNSGRSNAWFIAFAPYEAPRYAVCVLVRNGKSGGTVAGPIARRILEGAKALEDGDLLNYGPLEEALAHDELIEQTVYDDESLADLVEVPEENTEGTDAPALVEPDVITEQTPLQVDDDQVVETPVELDPVELEPVELEPVEYEVVQE